MKRCTSCGIEKTPDAFYKHKGRADGLTSACKECSKAKVAAYAKANPAKVRGGNKAAGAKFREANRTSENKRLTAYYHSNRDVCRATERKYFAANKPAHTARQAARRALKLRATPGWANHKSIALLYELASLESKRLGVAVHVDHIIPLKSSRVCGLHCEQNLQLLVATENLMKSNRVWPDM